MPSSSERLTLAYSSLGHTYCHLFMLLFPTVVLALEREIGMPYHELIGLMFLGNILYGVGAIPAGFLGDRWSARGMMMLFFIGTGVASLATGASSTPFAIGLSLTALGLFSSIYHPVGIAWVVRRAAKRGRTLGINGVFGSLGVVLAPVIAGALTDFATWRLAFILPGLLSIGTGLVLAYHAWRGYVGEDHYIVASQPAESTGTDMRRAVMVLAITVACTGLIYQATSFALPKILESRLGDMMGGGLLGVGLLVSAIYICSGLAQIAGGWMADRFKTERVYLICWALQVPLLIVAAYVDTILLVPVAAAMVVANTISSPSENSLCARFTPPKWRGTAFGVKFLLSLGVAAAAIPMIAWVYAETGKFELLLIILAGLAGLAALAAIFLPRSGDDAADEPAGPLAPVAPPAE
jgi:FSR family fosmidomycin resistance protein-like MFS transporter